MNFPKFQTGIFVAWKAPVDFLWGGVGRGVVRTREKNSRFNRGWGGLVESGGQTKKGIEQDPGGGNSSGKFKSSRKWGHLLIQSLRLEGALPQNNFYLTVVA